MNTVDLLIHNARIVDVFRLRIFEGWLSVREGRFLHVESGEPPAELKASEVIDLNQALIVPGLIDSHMHIESSQITPATF